MSDTKQRRAVSSEIINKLVNECADRYTALTTEFMDEGKTIEEYSFRVVAAFGAMELLLKKFVMFMTDNGYTLSEIQAITKNVLEAFTFIKKENEFTSFKPPDTNIKN